MARAPTLNPPVAITGNFVPAMAVLFPNAVRGTDWDIGVTDDGRLFLWDWHLSSPIPSADQIAAAVGQLTIDAARAMRAEAYRAEADPLFFKAQRGEADMQAWHDKVVDIRARIPVKGQ